MKRLTLFAAAGSIFCMALLFATGTGATILIVSPHPDDDVLIASGVAYRALAGGEPVIVVYVTNGDYLGAQMGYRREEESVNAEAALGNTENNLIFLGYPDGYTQTLYTNYPLQTDRFTTPLGQSTTYGNRGLGRSDYHSYKFGRPAPYNLYYMVMDLAQIIRNYKPHHIITTAEFDQHADHSTTYYVLGLALQAALPGMPTYSPTVHKSLVHWQDWPLPMDPTQRFSQPPNLNTTTVAWSQRESLDVPLPMQSLDYRQNPKYRACQAEVQPGWSFRVFGEVYSQGRIFLDRYRDGRAQPRSYRERRP